MTEEEWLTSENAVRMIEFLDEQQFKRKLGLFAAGVLLDYAKSVSQKQRASYEVAERYADGLATPEELWQYWGRSNRPFPTTTTRPVMYPDLPRFWATGVARQNDLDDGEEPIPSNILVSYLRDIVGNPFRPVAFAPEWRTSAAVALAAAMYDARAFGNMPVLADALEEAGCDDADILAHCRNPDGVHVRGCWVVDLLLGKS